MATLISGPDTSAVAWGTAMGIGGDANLSYASGRLTVTGELAELLEERRVGHHRDTQQFSEAPRRRNAVGKCPLRHPV
jgi:hypothetical protein